MILDSNFIIDIAKGNSLAIQRSKELTKNDEALKTTAINAFEVLRTTRHSTKKEKKTIYHLLAKMELLSFDFNSAKIAAKIHTDLIKKGKMIDAQDAMIAGIAKQRRETVLTKNIKHFNRIQGITVETY